MLKVKLWVKITGVATSGGMAVALFGGAAVHRCSAPAARGR